VLELTTLVPEAVNVIVFVPRPEMLPVEATAVL